MACTSSCRAQATISCTDRLCPKWITSHPEACIILLMMLMAASCPSKRDPAVTILTAFLGTYGSGDPNIAWYFISCLNVRPIYFRKNQGFYKTILISYRKLYRRTIGLYLDDQFLLGQYYFKISSIEMTASRLATLPLNIEFSYHLKI